TADSGDAFYRQVSDKPLDELKLRPETRDELRQVFYFEPEGCVKRVVFIATPHHGSRLSPALPGQLARRLVKLPKRLLDDAADLDGVASEVTVPADHVHVHHHPLAIREVRRILLEHARELEPVRQAVATPTAAKP